jgi:hypothetical protein
MSSLTKSQFITQIKARSALLAGFTDATLSTFIDIALRAFSEVRPEIRVDVDNTYSEELVDVPSGYLNVLHIDSDSRNRIEFAIENQGSGDHIRLGNIVKRSYDDLIEQEFYIDPMNSEFSSDDSYTSYDIEYSILQTMSSIKDTSLEAVYNHVLYQACSNKAETIAMAAGNQEIVSELRDTDASGAETAVKFNSSKDQVENFTKLAESYLQQFNNSVGVAFGVRS